MSMQLKLDNWVKRDPDRSARNIPKNPLTALESAYLAIVSCNACLRSYKVRMLSSAIMSDFEDDRDLNGESYIFMWNILMKFDTEVYKDKITGFVYIKDIPLDEKLQAEKKELKKSLIALQREYTHEMASLTTKPKLAAIEEKFVKKIQLVNRKLQAVEKKIKENQIEMSLDAWVHKGAEIHLEDGTRMANDKLIAKAGEINWVMLEYWKTTRTEVKNQDDILAKVVLEDGTTVLAKDFFKDLMKPTDIREMAKRNLKVIVNEDSDMWTQELLFKDGDINMNTVQQLVKKGAELSYMKKKSKDSEKVFILKWKGQDLKTFDVTGPKNPKTLKFFFVNYYYSRVNFVACEARAQKKQRGVGPAESISEVSYDPEDNASVSIHNHQHEITGKLLGEVQKRSEEFRRFFFQTYTLEVTSRELRDEYGEKFNALSSEMKKFITDLKKQHKNLVP